LKSKQFAGYVLEQKKKPKMKSKLILKITTMILTVKRILKKEGKLIIGLYVHANALDRWVSFT
jgi:hypothetical protein